MENLRQKIEDVVAVYKSKSYTKAESMCKNLLESNPKIAFLYNLMGVISISLKKNEDAERYYIKGIKIDPKFPMLYINLANLYFKNNKDGNIKKVEDLYKKAISLNREIAEPHNNLGNLYTYVNKFEMAIKSYQAAINLNPKFAFAYHNLANTYVTTGNLVKAQENFKKAIELDPNFTPSHRSLSRLKKYNSKD